MMNLQGRNLKLDLRGDDVKVLHRELAVIGFKVPEAERQEAIFGRGTHEAVTRFQKEHRMEPTGVVDAETARAINVAVEAATFIVEGKVASRSRAGVAGLRIEIMDKNIELDVRLDETQTDDGGSYRTTFTIADLRQRGKQRLDLQARAFAGEPFLGASNVRYNASNRETLNILLTEKASSALASEHETLIGALSTHFRGNLRDLKETNDRQDITYLANKTGWDARAVAMAALADQSSAKTRENDGVEIEPAFFYALFRAGLPANENALYQTDVKTGEAIWNQGIAQGVIPAALKDKIPQALKRFRELVAKRALDDWALAGVSMLSVSGVDNGAQQKQFAEIYTEHHGDPPTFWDAVREAFGEEGEEKEKRLRLDGQLGYLTLNNAPLMRKLHDAAGRNALTDTATLAAGGYYDAKKWRGLIGNDAVPPEIPGENDEEKRTRYAELLAAQVRLSFPTAVVAQMIKSEGIKLLDEKGQPISDEIVNGIHAFLTEYQGNPEAQRNFEIGIQPVEQFVKRNELRIDANVIREVKRIQRVYQITPTDGAMNALLKKGLDSAYAVVRYGRDEFVRTFKDSMGSEADALLTYAKAQQVHNAVLNIVISYLTQSNAPALGWSDRNVFVIDPTPAPVGADVIAGATLEGLFGELDYCACEHCRSILSPAAYLVNLLQFIDPDPEAWKTTLKTWKDEHNGAPYPFPDMAAWNNAGNPANTEITPLEVLLSRRPDIQYLPLTCENTNTRLPYIDLVNETLEYFVANDTENLSLKGYEGHSTDGSTTSEELLTSPQFVRAAAYATLAGAHFPPPLPFYQPLENLRLYFGKFESPLSEGMEALRKDDNLDRANANEYAWRDILMEELRLSRAEYKLLTNYDPPQNQKLTLQAIYGFAPANPDADVLAELSNAKAFTRRVGITYDDIIEILKTRFVNPSSTLIPRLERLGVPYATLKKLKDTPPGDPFDAEFDEALAPHLDVSQYDGDIKAWVRNNANYTNIMSLITLANPTDEEDLCSFDKLEFRYADPDKLNQPIRAFEFVRLIRFIRLWKKLGWTIDQTDKAITALYPANQVPNHADDAVNLQRLDAGFLTMLPRLGVAKRVMDVLELKPNKDLLPLLACFAPIDMHGAASLYRQMFLSPALLQLDAAFADDGYGGFLTDGNERLADHEEALRAAFRLTDDEFALITGTLFPIAPPPVVGPPPPPLSVEIISQVFRHGWLARTLKLSVREILLLTRFTGIDPFAAPDPPNPPILRLIEFVNRLRAVSLKPVQALYLIWNQDISDRSVPDDSEISGFARTLRSDLAAIESGFALEEDSDGSIARARMALVYGNESVDLFFGLLDNKVVTDVPYNHGQATLEQPILDAALGRIAYDNLAKRLSYTAGVLSDVTRDALKAVVGVTQAFKDAVDELHKNSRGFFVRYPELLRLYDAYATSNESPEKKRAELLTELLKELKPRRKRQQALQTMSAAANADVAFASALLDDAAVLHAAGDNTRPALDDFLALEKPGLSAQFFFRDTATGTPVHNRSAEANLSYSPAGSNRLPANLALGNPISGIWTGYLEAPENGFYNLHVDADAGATVTLHLGGASVALPQSGNVWSNAEPIELRAGTLYAISLKVEKVTDTLIVRWETAGRGREIIPKRYLYSATLTDHLRTTYIRFLKAVSLATNLRLTAAEIAHFASHADYQIGGRGWLNSLPVTGNPDNATSAELLKAFTALLDFARIKADLAPEDERLLAILEDPAAATQNPESLLFTLTRWTRDSLDALFARFGKGIADLAHIDTFRRVYDAYVPVKKLGVPASALINAATNEPNTTTVRDLQGALRARYDQNDWLKVVRPINDQMRGLQRDALVAYILHQLRQKDTTKHIDTPDRLFEYFLMDVQTDPCMETSRIRHALSSVQLFIERCLMNLEARVASSSINAKQWEWMKRYRVWEANRKVFLYPENWLEPELRDDQSPFFKETISELLQSDITEDRATTALLNYLSKLEEVAKLEPCGIHYIENDPGMEDDIAHVVARTAGANRNYFYRRREYGYWTPWEEIKLDIEDNPVLPVVWKGRLFLFWLRILKQAPLGTPQLPTGHLAEVEASSLVDPDATKMMVQAILCWSEYYNGKWQPTKTSDVNRPAELAGQFDAAGVRAFDRSKLRLSVFEEEELDALVVNIFGEGWSTFRLYNTHTLPEAGYIAMIDRSFPTRTLDTLSATFTITYDRGWVFSPQGGTPLARTLTSNVLKNDIGDRTVEPRHDLQKPWQAPFFYEDARHIFYVTTAVKRPLIAEISDYGVSVFPNKGNQIPPLVVKEDPRVWASEDKFAPVTIGRDPGVVDPAPIERFVSEDAYIDKGIGTTGTVRYDDTEIGPPGMRNNTHRP